MKKNLGIIALIVAIAAVFSFAFDFMDANAQQTKVTVSDSGSRDGKRRPSPTPRIATWTGNGVTYDGGDFAFTSSRCEESEGDPYIYWVLTASGKDSINSASITIDGAGPFAMSRVSKGSFKYTQTFGSGFVAPTNVSASYTNAKSAKLVVSHGCTGEVAAAPSFTLSFDETDEALANAFYNPCPQEPFPFSGYTGETIEVCDFGGGTNLLLFVPVDYTVTSSPEANCTADGGVGLTGGKLEGTAGGPQGVLWTCAVTSPNTVITITAPSGPPPSCDANGATVFDFTLTLTGVSGSYNGVTFTNETLTLKGTGDSATIFYGNLFGGTDPLWNYASLGLGTTTITISNTVLNNTPLDDPMQFMRVGTGYFAMQRYTNGTGNSDMVVMSAPEMTGMPQSTLTDPFTNCYTAPFASAVYIDSQWNLTAGTIPVVISNKMSGRPGSLVSAVAGGGGNPDDFIIKVSSDVVPFKFTLPLRGTPVDPNDEFGDRLDDVDVTINWGTGAPASCPTSATASGNVTCKYTTAGTYTITVSKGSNATGPWLYGFGSYDYLWSDFECDNGCVEIPSASITEVVSFGNLGITSFLNGFANMRTNPQMPATLPATVRSTRSMFDGASTFNQNLSSWNTENVTNMEQMFSGASAFNNGCADGVSTCPLPWNTSAVTNMRTMFFFNEIFNQNIGTWDTSSVTNMGQMFTYAFKFNQDIGSWVTSSVTDMSNMFNNAYAFNQNISGWNTGNVTNMDQMFLEASAFNQPIGVWNTGKVVVMRNMFYRANAFNQPIGTWDVSSVRYLLGDQFGGGFGFQGMFYQNTGFNQDLSAWCVSPEYTTTAAQFNTGANSTWVNNASFQPQWGSPPAICIE